MSIASEEVHTTSIWQKNIHSINYKPVIWTKQEYVFAKTLQQ